MTATPLTSPRLRRVYWETTAGCNLRCIHCRRVDIQNEVSMDELSFQQAARMIDDLAAHGKPVLILSGGEPLFRRDIFELAEYASLRGLPVALSTNGTLVTAAMARRIRASGVYYASISLDGACAETHDRFRGEGNFERALSGFHHLKECGIKVQVNFTVTKSNVHEASDIHALVRNMGAQALYLFLLVPVGCGVQIADDQMLDAQEVERWLHWVRDRELEQGMEVRAICAPQYYRVKAQSLPEGVLADSSRMGCLAGINICFVSHRGEVFPCGYLPVSAGNVKEKPLSGIWAESAMFASLRDASLLSGKCGACSYKTVCGGCRARAYSREASILAEEPYCDYRPATSPA